jgi:hypothetical protein
LPFIPVNLPKDGLLCPSKEKPLIAWSDIGRFSVEALPKQLEAQLKGRVSQRDVEFASAD